jgi:histidinol-phosphate aminotransferase
LKEDIGWVHTHVSAAAENRSVLVTTLREMGLEPLDSQANFVFVPVSDALRIATRMRALGVAVRPFAGLPPVSPALRASGGTALRISVGPWNVLQTALDALRTALRGDG